MKTYDIELQRLKGMSHGNGLVVAQVDAAVMLLSASSDGSEPSTCLRMTEATARVLQALLKTQLAEFDKRKARSQR